MNFKPKKKRNYSFQLTEQDFEGLRRLAERDTEGNVSFYVRRLVKQDLAKNAEFLKTKTK
jgi:hypothetical protein